MATTLDEVWALFRETDRKFQETDRLFKDTQQEIKALSQRWGEWGGKGGLFVENRVAPACETIFAPAGTVRTGADGGKKCGC